MMKYAVLLAGLFASFAPEIGWGQEVGDPAPPLSVEKWVQGGPYDTKPGTNIYVLEVWASSLPGCRLAIPYLNDIQNRFRTNGVVVVGISDEPGDAIQRFVQNEETNIQYALAADDHRLTVRSYMGPIKQRVVPYVFVVGTNGLVLWHGNSFGSLEKALELIVAGKYHMAFAAKREVAALQMGQYLGLAQRGDFRAKTAGASLLANRTNDVPLLCDMAYQISTDHGLPKRDFALAGQALDQAEVLSSNTPSHASVMSIRAVWLFTSGRRNEGLTLMTQALASAKSPLRREQIKLLAHSMEEQMTGAGNKNGTNQVKGVEMPVAEPAGTNHVNVGQSAGLPGHS